MRMIAAGRLALVALGHRVPRDLAAAEHQAVDRVADRSTIGSSSTSSNEPVVRSSIGERLSFMRSGAFGVNSTSGLRTSRRTWRRSRWKYCAAVVALHTWMLSSAHD